MDNRATLSGCYGGALFDLLNPDPRAVDFGVIAEHLSKINRFRGATIAPYSVAQHSVIVADHLPPEMRVYGLLHDAHEAYIGDVSAPTEAALVLLGMTAALDILRANIDAAIWQAAMVPPPPPEIAARVHAVDRMACKSEARDLIPFADPADYGPWPMLNRTIKPLPWDRAHEAFLRALETVGINARRRAA